ncbi:MAG: enoyl-CoA hydratase/isomerase family protein [Acidobacteria bacterium]|nr:enoyl-CoA hydratase/isomerase family protein [Acidobacteriota bacterium]
MSKGKELPLRYFESSAADRLKFQYLLYAKADGIARITIHRPEVYNSYNTPCLVELREAFRDAAFDDKVGVIVLTGAGEKAFCTGGDVKEYAEVYTRTPRDYWKYMTCFQEALDAIRNTGKPVIARLNGMVVGGGNELNLACDLAVAADHAIFRQVGTRVGSVAAGGATQWLPITIGDRRAREMLFLCEEISAAKALEWGLVNQVVPKAQLDEAVNALAQKLLDKFPECLRYTKQQVNFWKDLVWHLSVGHARDWLTLHFTGVEPYEGMTAFVEKRPPDYRGLRRRAAEGGSSEYLFGPPARTCAKCGAKGLPADFKHCGLCGARLE